jgi:drug/metabolite transporter (DMT)-like permease
MSIPAVLSALAAAALFGLSTPLAKLLVGEVAPMVLAAIFYLGSGVGLAVYRALSPGKEAGLTRGDLPWLAGAILSGGVAGPILLMIGLSWTDAGTVSLLLTLEGVATALIAWFVFRENFDRRIALGMALIMAGAIVLAWQDTAEFKSLAGMLVVAVACVAWAIDNNLTRKVSVADPVQIAMIKGLCGGAVSLAIALAAGHELPSVRTIGVAALVGLLGYGMSLALFIRALRGLGSARTGAYFSTAPFLGTAGAVVLLDQPLTMRLLAAGALMAAGVWLHLTERHEHEHVHERLEHTHLHSHDTHHQHAHPPGTPPGEPHTHVHVHEPMRHAHPHVPDIHHRHQHAHEH